MTASKKKALPSGWWMWLVSAALIPAVVMLYFYVQNMIYSDFAISALFCGICVLFGVAAWAGAYLVFRSPVSAFAACVVGWLFLFSYNTVKELLTAWGIPIRAAVELGLVALVGVLCLLAALLFRRTSGQKARQPVLLFLCLIFGFNAVQAAAFLLGSGDAPELAANKETFTLSDQTDRPNVVWFHCDGMLSFDAVEKYFGDSQDWFTSELEKRGFQINRSARFEALHKTTVAVPALMCPDAYDNYIAPNLTDPDQSQLLKRQSHLTNLDRFRLNNELIRAFDLADYRTRIINSKPPYFYPITDEIYDGTSTSDIRLVHPSREELEQFLEKIHFGNTLQDIRTISHPIASVLARLFPSFVKTDLSGMAKSRNLSAPLPEGFLQEMLEGQSEASLSSMNWWNIGVVLAGLYDMDLSSPSFTVIFNGLTHNPYGIDENGNVLSPDSLDVMDYYPQHLYASKVLINMIDLVLEKDPNAVIILQGDHGMHDNTHKEFQQAFGPDTPAQDLWNSVISAVRVPEACQTGEESHATGNPLNISRYLVNSFVGPNYEYLP